MLDILGNLDIVNQIVQSALDDMKDKELEVRWNYLSSPVGYLVDISEPRKNSLVFQINSLMNRQNLCKIAMTKKEMVIRYSPKFLFIYKPITNTFQSSQFDEPFFLEDMESTFFTQHCIQNFSTDVAFDYDIMISTLDKIRELYYVYINFITKRENTV